MVSSYHSLTGQRFSKSPDNLNYIYVLNDFHISELWFPIWFWEVEVGAEMFSSSYTRWKWASKNTARNPGFLQTQFETWCVRQCYSGQPPSPSRIMRWFIFQQNLPKCLFIGHHPSPLPIVFSGQCWLKCARCKKIVTDSKINLGDVYMVSSQISVNV